ncbi:MAG: hypothetical protein IIB39_10990 [Candidatus Marinimicrobia bacterium]|nr:hypothetical protein [Candidatus Neomarinimicrobiota bacterium]
MFLIYISVSVSFQSCSNSTEPNLETNEVLVNVPTNNYLVKANISQLGFFGCANVTVYKDGAVTDAIVKINEVELFYQFNELYSDTTGSMIYKVGRKYELTVSHNGVEIANGTAIMPSEPTITGLPDTSDHPANQALTVSWKKPSSASSVLILLESNINNDDDYESGYLNPTINSHTIPGSEFLLNGEYKLTVIAFHGFLPGTVEDSSKGYNISGSAGEFIASNVSPTVVLRVTDGVNKQVHKKIRDKSNNLSRLLKSKDQYEFLKLLRR